jgi:hypothetical protein
MNTIANSCPYAYRDANPALLASKPVTDDNCPGWRLGLLEQLNKSGSEGAGNEKYTYESYVERPPDKQLPFEGQMSR